MTGYVFDYDTQAWRALAPWQVKDRAAIDEPPTRGDNQRPHRYTRVCKLPYLDREWLTETEARGLKIYQRQALKKRGVRMPDLRRKNPGRPRKSRYTVGEARLLSSSQRQRLRESGVDVPNLNDHKLNRRKPEYTVDEARGMSRSNRQRLRRLGSYVPDLRRAG